MPAPAPPARDPRVLEEGDVRAWVAGLVGVEQVIDGGVVLVDRLLHQPQPEDAGVEVDVALRVGGDRCDVVDAFELHRCSSVCRYQCTPGVARTNARCSGVGSSFLGLSPSPSGNSW